MELSFLGTFYSVLTGLTFATFYILNKKSSFAGKPLVVILAIFSCHLPILLIWILLSPPSHITWFYFIPGFAAIALTMGGNILTIRALSLSPFSLMVPILGLCPVFSTLISIPLLGEWPSNLQWLGILLSVLGIFWLYVPAAKPWNIFSFWPSFIKERGALSMTIAALLWAVGSPIDQLALRHADPQFHALFVYTGFVTLLFIWVLSHKKLYQEPLDLRLWPLLALSGAVGGLSFIFQLLALQHTPAGPFEAIKRVISQVLAVLFGYLFFHEKITKPKLIGILILSVGVPLIVI